MSEATQPAADPLAAVLAPARPPKGVRKEPIELIAKVAGGPLARDLLLLAPHSAINRGNIVPIAETREGEIATIEAEIDARDRVMLEMNVSKDHIDALVKGLPAMRSPTVSQLYGDDGYAIKIAVKKSDVPNLLPKLKSLGATGILEYELRKVMA